MNASTVTAQRAGRFALVGAVLLFASVAAELVHPVQAPDGTSREPLLHAAYLIAWIVGSACLTVALTALRSMLRDAGVRSRAASAGAWLSIVGAALFGVLAVGGLTGIVAGTYLEIAFVAFLLALVLLIPSQLLLVPGVRRLPAPVAFPSWLLVVASVGLIVALGADMDPFHDLGLFTFALAWAGIGATLARASAHTDLRPEAVAGGA
jgi:hypothetical protein